MKHEQHLKNSIKKAMNSPAQTKQDTDKHSNIQQNHRYHENLAESQREKVTMNQAKNEPDDKGRSKKLEKPLKIFGAICLAVSILAFMFTGTSTVDTSESAKNALKNKTSTAVSAGTVLLSEDQNVEAKDYTITHNSAAKDTKIWVWDFAAEDGDYVQVLINGSPVSDAFMIKHKPREITVPAAGEVQIKGIRDGGGGITYAVRYEINGTSYFNGAPEGEKNTYTLRKE